ncbi:MAG: 3-isopropylmalate dehydratase small subunit [candidate division Zixibacteria bacterium]|nr:3-isopropylmalate dehydratase small subunit [candidate division Zixibacteria bacterium]
MEIKGKVFKYGDAVNTDVILPGRWCHLYKPEDLKKHCLEDLDKDFAANVEEGDIIAAGENFGCGSSREVAPLSIKSSGISAIIAKSFARIFYRNSINIGLPILESPEAVENISAGNEVSVNMAEGTITNHTTGKTFNFVPFPEFMRDILAKGGIRDYILAKVK